MLKLNSTSVHHLKKRKQKKPKNQEKRGLFLQVKKLNGKTTQKLL